MKKPIYLFQGDSITDANRNRSLPDHLGYGYVPLIQEALPEVTVLNRGVSGDRTIELLDRWKTDCLDLHPDVVSIFVGINDIWHKYKWNKPMTNDLFEANYRKLLDRVKEANPLVRLLLISPFVFPLGDYDPIWRDDLNAEIAIVAKLAAEYGAIHLPLEKIMFDAAKIIPMKELADDGIHPTPRGHRLIADAILNYLAIPSQSI
ncbi:MAG: SGNH/GDSL hydrolase family protein [Bacillus subtilis]|nr:SGNH/GDSL hydrolase family protein [Bacillus subtilis]